MSGLGMLYLIGSVVFFLGFWPRWAHIAINRQEKVGTQITLLLLIGGLSPIIAPLFLAAWLYEQYQEPEAEEKGGDK